MKILDFDVMEIVPVDRFGMYELSNRFSYSSPLSNDLYSVSLWSILWRYWRDGA